MSLIFDGAVRNFGKRLVKKLDSSLVKKVDILKISSEKKVFIVLNQTLSWQEFIIQFFLIIIAEISQIGCKH
jgi:hypothetical protein